MLAGFETDVCVAQSAVGLVELGFRAVVLEDATYTNSAREHERGLARMAGTGVERNHCKGADVRVAPHRRPGDRDLAGGDCARHAALAPVAIESAAIRRAGGSTGTAPASPG